MYNSRVDNRLTLQAFGLKYVPPEIGELRYLEYLCLSENYISAVPGLIGNLTNLTKLDLSKNQLTALPGETAKLQKLRELILDKNSYGTMPLILQTLTALEVLSMADNKIYSVAEFVGVMQVVLTVMTVSWHTVWSTYASFVMFVVTMTVSWHVA